MRSFLRDLGIVVGSVVVALVLVGVGLYIFAPSLFTHPGEATMTSTQTAASKVLQDAAPANLQYAGQLQQAGGKTCVSTVETLGRDAIGTATDTASAANWYGKSADTHMTMVFIGQKFGKTPALPFGLSTIVAAPTAEGKCDGTSIRVLPSPLSCPDLQKSIIQNNGKPIGELAGVPFVQSPDSQIALIPTSGPGCVLVEVRLKYGE